MNIPKGPWSNIDTQQMRATIDAEPSAFDFLQLTRMQRIYGFVACVAVGFIMSILGSVLFVVGQVTAFALLYVFGVLVSLAGTGFLIGFGTQFKLMFKPVRLVAALIFLGSIVMVFIGAFVVGSDAMVLIFAVMTYLAYIWYSLSYIPYARDLAKKVFGGLV